MLTTVSRLTLDSLDRLPAHARRCVFWEIDPAISWGSGVVSDPQFEKEAWLSTVMLEWGSCGQVATLGDQPAGCALYAPPSAVPRSGLFPTSPVSADAVLLTTLRTEGVTDSNELGTQLIHAVVADLIRRGVRALEAFGIRPDGGLGSDGDGSRMSNIPFATAARECSPETCMIQADFLTEVGFEVVAPHARFPRLRLELNTDHGWKEDVERALDQLLAAAAIVAERERAALA
ncbi:hypothetical protein, partial [Skermania pinensis]